MNLLAFADLVRRFAAGARASAGSALDFSVGSVWRAIAEANAALALWLQWLILVALRQTRLATSIGAECDTFGADFGFTRLAAAPASGLATFARLSSGQAAIVPVGAQAKSTDGTQVFAVTADVTNAAWNGTGYAIPASAMSVTVPVTAVTPGAASNIQPGALSVLASSIAGVDTVTNAALFAGGVDAESDAAFRTRFALFVDSRSRATLSAVTFAATSYQQGLNVAIAPNMAPDGSSRAGFFTVTVDDGSGSPPLSVQNGVYAAIDAVRPVGTAFVVQPPSVVNATISLIITAAPGYLKATLLGPVATAIINYIGTLQIGQPLPYSRLASLAYGVPGVQNATAILLNGGTADLGGGPSQVVRVTAANVAVA